MAVWKLAQVHPREQRPYLFYVAFADQATIEKLEESHIIHPELEITTLPAATFRHGTPWERLTQQRPELAERLSSAPLAVVLHGEVAELASLDYLRDTLELFSSLVDHGALGVYDPLTLTWWSADQWKDSDLASGLFNPFDHLVIEEELQSDGAWALRTRGLRKFACPDLLVRQLTAEEKPAVSKMLDRFLHHLAWGGLLDDSQTIAVSELPDRFQVGPCQGQPDAPLVELLRVAPSESASA